MPLKICNSKHTSERSRLQQIARNSHLTHTEGDSMSTSCVLCHEWSLSSLAPVLEGLAFKLLQSPYTQIAFNVYTALWPFCSGFADPERVVLLLEAPIKTRVDIDRSL